MKGGPPEMNLVALRKEVDQISMELTVSGDIAEKRFLELRAEIDQIKLELAALKKFLDVTFPEFSKRFPPIMENTIEQVNPETE